MKEEEIKIITLGDIFRNLETEEQAFEFLKYIKNLQQENERLKDNAIHNDKVVDKARWNEMIYKSRVEKAVKYNYELQERYCHSALYDELVASKIYEITEKELNILQNGSDEE